MQTKENKEGISLIVLIITIILVIILAAVVILTLSKNNPIESAKEARFKEDVRTFQDELAMTVSKEYANAGGHRDEKISTSNFEKIKEYIPSFNEKYKDKFFIQDDELVYTNKVEDYEKEWLDKINVSKYALLPKEYQQVEYIESTGTQYIDTREYVKTNTQVVLEFEHIKQNSGGWKPLLGYRVNRTNNMFSVWITNSLAINYGSVDTSGICSIQYNKKYIVKNKINKWFLNDNLITTIDSNISENNDYTVLLYALRKSGGSVEQRGTLSKVFRLYFYDDDILLKDFIPCYSTTTVTNVDGEICEKGTAGLYDLVEGKFYTNKGDKTKGDFICGPEV